MRRLHVAAYDVNLYVRGDIQIRQAEQTIDKAVYTAQHALITRHKITRDGHTYEPTNETIGRTDGHTLL